jgi:hypothetical protein
MIFKKYEECKGLSLPAIGRWKIEFWYAPRGYEIKEHTVTLIKTLNSFLYFAIM